MNIFAEITDRPEYISYVSAAISACVTGLVAYVIGRRKNARSEFSELVIANSKFRDEIKIELDNAKEVIAKLEVTITKNAKTMDEMQAAISALKQQIITKETKISDMQMEMIKKDYQIQNLQESK